MSISELLAVIGDDNIAWQNLDDDSLRLNMVGKHTQITFGTSMSLTPTGTEKLGLIVWLDRDDVKRVREATPSNPKENEK